MSLPTGFTELANQRYIEARTFWQNWRGCARDDFAFVAGAQWLASDISLLQEQKRPPITFNYCEKMVDAVVGAEISSRQEITYAPRTVDDAPATELWTNAAKWVRDQGNVEDEESDAFRDALICGLGWTHTKVSFDTDPQGMIETHRIDSLEMLPDPTARKPGLIDRRYSFRDLWIDERQAAKLWPDAILFGTPETDASRGVDIERAGQGYESETEEERDSRKGQVQIRHYECVELEPYYRVATSDNAMDVDTKAFSKMKADLDSRGVKYVKMNKRVYYSAYFAGETLLEGAESPTQQGFTYQAITCKRDRNKNTWYGLIRVMKDPQRWANKWLSQILHIINSNAKGGLLAEQNAFLDPRKAQDEWSMPESITLLKEGGINKIKEKAMTTYPAGLDRLMEFALSSLPQVTGINLEALGLAGREQANVLEQSRKQAAYGLLAPIFDALRRYRKNQGRILLDFINNYISDGRMIRIGGPESRQFIPLTKAPEAAKYDVIVDQSPHAPDVKRDTWQALQSLIPAAMKAGMPIPPGILKYAPIPTALALEWEKNASQNHPTQEQMQQLQQQLQQLQQQNQQLQQQLRDKSEELKLDAQESQQELQIKTQSSQSELQLKQQESFAEHQRKLRELELEHERKMIELEKLLALKEQEAAATLILKKQEQDASIAIQKQQASKQPSSKD